MPNLNRVQIIGRLGKDPEARTTKNGSTVVSFSVAVDRMWKSRDGESRKETDWFNVEAWGKLGQICEKFLGKGRLVFIEGRLSTTRWENEGTSIGEAEAGWIQKTKRRSARNFRGGNRQNARIIR